MRRHQPVALPSEISTQASQMRKEFPELFAYLQQRDTRLQRARTWYALRHDVESCANQNPWLRIEALLRDLEPGIAEISDQDRT